MEHITGHISPSVSTLEHRSLIEVIAATERHSPWRKRILLVGVEWKVAELTVSESAFY